jgi:hypothetical protein
MEGEVVCWVTACFSNSKQKWQKGVFSTSFICWLKGSVISSYIYGRKKKELEVCWDICSHVVCRVARVDLSGAPVPLLTAASCQRRRRQSSESRVTPHSKRQLARPGWYQAVPTLIPRHTSCLSFNPSNSPPLHPWTATFFWNLTQLVNSPAWLPVHQSTLLGYLRIALWIQKLRFKLLLSSCDIIDRIFLIWIWSKNISKPLYLKTKLRGLSPRANYTDRATTACWRVSANFCL